MENFETFRLDQTGQQTQAILDQVSTNTADIAQLRALYEALTQSEPVIIQPSDTWPVADPQENVIYRVIDRVNTPPQSYSDYMWNGTAMVLMATYNNSIDNVPTPGSNNLVKSGGVAASIVFDISAYHATGSTLATYANLSAALGTDGANVPASVRKGGMSVKFVKSSDNKYVQYRFMLSTFTDAQFTNADNWQGIDDEPTVDSDNLVKSGGVAKFTKCFNIFGLKNDFGYRCGNYLDGGLATSLEGSYGCLIQIDDSCKIRLNNVSLRGGNIIWISCYSELPTVDNAISVYLGYPTENRGFYTLPSGTKYVLFNITVLDGFIKVYNNFDIEKTQKIDVVDKEQIFYGLSTDYGYRCGDATNGGIVETSANAYACLVRIGSQIKFNLSNVSLRGNSRQWLSCYSDLPTVSNATSVYLGYADGSGDFYITKENTKFMLVNVTALGGLLKVYNDFDVVNIKKIDNANNKLNYYGLANPFDYRCGNYLDGGLTSITEGQTACILPIIGGTPFRLENVSLRGDNIIWISCYSDFPTPSNAASVYLGYPTENRGFLVAPNNTKYILFNVTALGGIVKTYINYDLQPKIWLPEKIYALRGVKLQLFLCGMVEAEFPDNISMDIQKITGSDGQNLCRMFEWTPGNDSTDLRYKFGYKSDSHLPYTTQSSSTDIVVVSKKSSPASNKNILCIGDSFTDADYYPSELKRLLTGVPSGNLSDPLEVNGNDGLTNLTFIGTQDPDFTRNEGYAGKSYHWFVTSNESPFWDSNESDINFTSYCTRNGYSQIDYAIILLGTNTGNDEADIKKMWDKLLAHNPNIKVIVMGRCFANHYGGTGSVGMSFNLTWYLESHNVIPLNQRLQRYCKENAYASNFLYVDYNVAFDSLHNMGTIMAPANARNPEAQVIQGNDNVHPSKYGYWQIADTVRAAIHYWCLE